jgi:hypothetical protein
MRFGKQVEQTLDPLQTGLHPLTDVVVEENERR